MSKREKFISLCKYIIDHTMFAYLVALLMIFGASVVADLALSFVGGWKTMILLSVSTAALAIGFLAGVGTVFYHSNKILRARGEKTARTVDHLKTQIAEYHELYGKLPL